MINSKVFTDPNQRSYQESVFSTFPQDRPLIGQICGNDPNVVLKAALKLQESCDAIDLNLGCPQAIAKKGHYGSYLQDEWELIGKIVTTLHENLQIPVTCKIRIFSDVEKTLRYAKMLQDSGCQMLTVHGRLREQRGLNTGLADWNQIKRIKQELNIPIVANGNILYHEDIEKCIEYTGCDGVMTAEGNLYNPGIFTDICYPVWQMASEYLNLCREYSAPVSYVRGHLFKLYRNTIMNYPTLRDRLAFAKKLEEIIELNEELTKCLKDSYGSEIVEKSMKDFVKDSEGYYSIPPYYCQPYFRTLAKNISNEENENLSKALCKQDNEQDIINSTENSLSTHAFNISNIPSTNAPDNDFEEFPCSLNQTTGKHCCNATFLEESKPKRLVMELSVTET